MASPDCDCVVLPVRYRGGISSLGNAEASQCAPAPHEAGLAQGGRSSLEKRVSPEQKKPKSKEETWWKNPEFFSVKIWPAAESKQHLLFSQKDLSGAAKTLVHQRYFRSIPVAERDVGKIRITGASKIILSSSGTCARSCRHLRG